MTDTKLNLWDKFKSQAPIYATGGITALQALKLEFFSFTPAVKTYLGHGLSIITIVCIFLGGSTVLEWWKKIQDLKKQSGQTPP